MPTCHPSQRQEKNETPELSMKPKLTLQYLKKNEGNHLPKTHPPRRTGSQMEVAAVPYVAVVPLASDIPTRLVTTSARCAYVLRTRKQGKCVGYAERRRRNWLKKRFRNAVLLFYPAKNDVDRCSAKKNKQIVALDKKTKSQRKKLRAKPKKTKNGLSHPEILFLCSPIFAFGVQGTEVRVSNRKPDLKPRPNRIGTSVVVGFHGILVGSRRSKV